MKSSVPRNILAAGVSMFIVALLTGCFETRQEFTINPDGSGKVVHECRFQNIDLTQSDASPEDALKEAIAKVISGAKGVDAWRDVSYKRLDDGRLFFKGTAYFKDLSKLSLPNQTSIDFKWGRNVDDAILTLRTNKTESRDGLSIERKPVDLSKLNPGERAAKLKEERAKFQQMKPMLLGFIGTMKQEVVMHLPGRLVESSNLKSNADGGVRIEYSGAQMLAAMEKLIENDAWFARQIGSLGLQERPALDEDLNELVFGTKAPVRAIVRGGKPLFDYQAELTTATIEFAKIQKGLGTAGAAIAPPAQGGTLTSVKIVGVRLVTQADKKREIRPFNSDAGYSVSLLCELPGSVLSVTDQSALDTAVADDGSSLLPKSDWAKRLHFPRLTTDKAGVVFDVELLPPPPQVKGIKELSGHLQYRVGGGTKEIDLGFDELKPQSAGSQLGARIDSIKDGWKKDGSQELELKLKMDPAALKSIQLVIGDTKIELNRRGYSSSGTSYSGTYESKTAFPPKCRLVAEVYDDLKTFDSPFKLENFSLLGTPLSHQ